MQHAELRPSTPIEALPGIGPRTGSAFRHLGIATAGDLLRHFPMRYEHDRGERTVADLTDLCERGTLSAGLMPRVRCLDRSLGATV
jgi:RecG-like helicase